MAEETYRPLAPLSENEVVVHVPKGTAKHVRIQEAGSALSNEITVQISKKRKAGVRPVLGVIVK